jgi:t-SNARE complex subunit (syntaxin)
VGAMKATYTSRDTQGKMESDSRKELTSRMAAERDSAARGQSSYTRANSDFVKDQANLQQTVRREQDASLDKLGSGLDTLKEMAVAIDAELKDQEKMIEDVDKGVDEAQGKLDGAIKSVEKILKTKDKCQLATIFILVVVFLIVAIVAFS